IAKEFQIDSLRTALGHLRTDFAIAAGDPPHDAEHATAARQVEPDHGIAGLTAQFARAVPGVVPVDDPLRPAYDLGHALSELGVVGGDPAGFPEQRIQRNEGKARNLRQPSRKCRLAGPRRSHHKNDFHWSDPRLDHDPEKWHRFSEEIMLKSKR